MSVCHTFKHLRQLNTNYFLSKDVRLPIQLQRVMAAEAEAAREARAKVTNIVIMKSSVILTTDADNEC